MAQRRMFEKTDQMKSFHIAVGTKVVLEVIGMNERMKSMLVGMKPENYLIISIPVASKIWKNLLYKGNQVTVRYVYAGTVYGFQSSLLGYIVKPDNLIFLSYPEKVEDYDLREHRRIDCVFPATAVIREQAYRGAIVDISTRGCKFSTRTYTEKDRPPIRVGEAIQIDFQLLGTVGTHSLIGKARNINLDDQKMDIGVEFDKTDTEVKDKIEDYVKSVMKDLGE